MPLPRTTRPNSPACGRWGSTAPTRTRPCSSGPAGAGPRLWFQLVPEPKQVKNRVHLDLCATDVEAEIARLTGLGASVLARHDENTILADPEGNEFCLSRLSARGVTKETAGQRGPEIIDGTTARDPLAR